MSSGSSSRHSVTNDAEFRSQSLNTKEDFQAPLSRGELEDSSNRYEPAAGFPWLLSPPSPSPSPPVQEDVGPLVQRLGPLQDGDPALLQQSSSISQFTERYREYPHNPQRLPNEEDVLNNLYEQDSEGCSRPGSRASSLFNHHVPPPGLHPGAQAGEHLANGNNVSLQGIFNQVNFLANNVLLRTNTLIDQCQIGPIENIYRELDGHITSLAHSQGLDPSLVHREVIKIREVLTEIEKRLAMFYYSVDPLTKLSIKFSISKLQDPNYLAALAGVAPIPNIFPSHQSHARYSRPPSPILTPRQSSSPV